MKSQKGFGLVPILLILILVTAVGATGYYVYNQQTSKKTDKSEVTGDTPGKVVATISPTTTPKATTTPQATATPTTVPAPSNVLIIPEMGLRLDYSQGPYKDVKYVMIENGKMAAIYSQQLFDKQVSAARKAGMTVSDSDANQRYSCSRAVYAYYQKYTGMGLDGNEMISPTNRPKDATLYVGGYGACDPGPGLGDEYSAFKDWVKNNLK